MVTPPQLSRNHELATLVGHFTKECPKNKAYGNWANEAEQMVRQGRNNGCAANHINLDTGTLVHRWFVPQSADTGGTVAMWNTTGTQYYPTAQVEIELDGRSYKTEVAVSERRYLTRNGCASVAPFSGILEMRRSSTVKRTTSTERR